MTALRYGFLGSPPFATDVLAALFESGRAPAIVVTQPSRPAGRGRATAPSPVMELASSHGVTVRRPESSKDPALRAELASLELDVLLIASYGELLDQAFLDLPRRFCLNVHGSLLPRWRGAAPVQAAIAAGDTVTGVTIQRVVKQLDAGDVMLALETPIDPDTTGGVLFTRLARLGGAAAVQALALIERGEECFVPQDPAGVTRCSKLTKESGAIDWSRPANEIERLVRAMDPWPGAATTLPSGERLVLWRTVVDGEAIDSAASDSASTATRTSDAGAVPGTVHVFGDDLAVATGAGRLRILELQAAGKKRMETGAWLRGARLASGARLGASAESF